jgi:hypothetical protein
MACVFFHPDFTVGTGFSPVLPPEGRSRTCSFILRSKIQMNLPAHDKEYHRQWGISPRPEDLAL